jgi:hypothetical protein
MGAFSITRRLKKYFNSKELYILVKYYSQKELTKKEKEDLNNWVKEFSHRGELFNQLKNTIEIQNEISVINTVADIENVVIKLKNLAPDEYIRKSEEKDILIIRSSFLTGVQDYGNELLIKLIKDHIWWGIMLLGLAFLVILLFIYFLIRISSWPN